MSHTPTRPQPPLSRSRSGRAHLRACGRGPSTGHIAATCCCIPSDGGGASSGLRALRDQAEATSSPGPLPSAEEAVEGGAQAAAARAPPSKAPLPLLSLPQPRSSLASAWAPRSESLGNRAGSADPGLGKPARGVSGGTG